MNSHKINNKYQTFLRNVDKLDESKLLDKNGNIDKYYLSFAKQMNANKKNIENPNDFKYLNSEIMTIKIPEIEVPKPKEKISITATINNINDLLQITKDYAYDDTKEYNINLKALHNIVEPLTELNNMIGMKHVKENIIDQILYYIQGLHKVNKKSSDYMHTVIYGSPGTGKTDVAKIIGKIFSKLGVLGKENSNKFRKVTRSDLVAGYLGQTAIKTRDVVNDSLGGVLFIDEAYSLGNTEKKDSFSKECIDTLCESLSNHKDNIMVIIAGYEQELNECFFSYNQGLQSRFPWRFKVDNYNSEELYNIFIKKVNDANWKIEDSTISSKWFDKKMVYFKYFGRDIEILFSKIKIAHSRRVFCLSEDDKTRVTLVDLNKGFELFLQNDEVKNRKIDEYKHSTLNLYV
jgi:SpoVK/Ycf46/Vps4 family AAA+-type ATPase